MVNEIRDEGRFTKLLAKYRAPSSPIRLLLFIVNLNCIYVDFFINKLL